MLLVQLLLERDPGHPSAFAIGTGIDQPSELASAVAPSHRCSPWYTHFCISTSTRTAIGRCRGRSQCYRPASFLTHFSVDKPNRKLLPRFFCCPVSIFFFVHRNIPFLPSKFVSNMSPFHSNRWFDNFQLVLLFLSDTVMNKLNITVNRA